MNWFDNAPGGFFYLGLLLIAIMYMIIAKLIVLAPISRHMRLKGEDWYVSKPIVWLALILFGVLSAHVFSNGLLLSGPRLLMGVLAALLPLLIFAFLCIRHARYRGVIFFSGMSFAFAALFMGAVALFFNTAAQKYLLPVFGLLLPGAMVLVIAPLIEELAKMLVLDRLLKGARETLPEAIFYGFAIGLGFAFIENVLYFNSGVAAMGAAAWGSYVLYRVFFSTLAHSYFAIAGSLAYKYVGGSRLRRFGYGWLFAFGLHMVYNAFSILEPVSIAGRELTGYGFFNPALLLVLTLGLVKLEKIRRKRKGWPSRRRRAL